MIVTGLNHYTIRAPTPIMEACVSFYTSVLNLRIGFRPPLPAEGFWLYAGEEPLVHLVADTGAEGGSTHLDHIAFTCINLPVTIRRLADLGIDYTTNHIPEIDQFQVFLKDPAGIGVELNFTCETIKDTGGPQPPVSPVPDSP